MVADSKRIVEFLRKRDLVWLQELGSGACGQTVLLFDDVIDENFVCKKYVPIAHEMREELFENFKREIKILHLLHHINIVRVFNYYLYPESLAGYILMEFVRGEDIDDYLTKNPEKIDSVFEQIISGFWYLEKNGILHRDIRPQNMLVNDEGVAKIIDFGFGKLARSPVDFDKSISLNWWCAPPQDFEDGKYDFVTEMYFVGKLFSNIIESNGIADLEYKGAIRRMSSHERGDRFGSFGEIRSVILSHSFSGIDFSDEEKEAYRAFANDLVSMISKIEEDTKLHDDPEKIQRNL